MCTLQSIYLNAAEPDLTFRYICELNHPGSHTDKLSLEFPVIESVSLRSTVSVMGTGLNLGSPLYGRYLLLLLCITILLG